MFLHIFAVAWLVIFSYLFYTIIFKHLKYTEYVIDLPDEWKPFQRQDRKNWKIGQMFVVGYFLLLPRLILFVCALVMVSLSYKSMGFVEKDNFNTEYPQWKRMVLKGATRFYAKILLFLGGFLWPVFKKEDINKYDKSYREPRNQEYKDGQPPITISNHVTWADILIICASRYTSSFLAKKEVGDLPIYGSINNGMQSLLIDRKSTDNKNFILKKIKERADNIKQGKNFNPIHIYPEGTTSSGRHIISFKKGAFEPLLPIGILCLKFKAKNCHPSIDLDEPLSLFLMMCQLYNEVEIIDLGTYYPEGNLQFKGDENDWEIYANKIKEIMCKCLELENSESGYRHFREYDQIRKNTYGPNKYVYLKKQQ